MAYLAGWIAHKMKSDNLGLKTSNEKYEMAGDQNSLAPWIFHMSRGGLKVPRDEFLLDMEKFEQDFINFHGKKKLKKGENIIRDYQHILITKYGPNTSFDYPQEMLCLFARARTFFRLRNNIQQLKDEKAEKNAKSAQKRKEKNDKKLQIASSAASTAYKPKKQRVYKKDARSFKQLGQHTT